VKDKIH